MIAKDLVRRLDLMVHLADARRGYLSEGSKRADHARLRKYGYGLDDCICGVRDLPLQVRMWRANGS